MRSLMTTGRIQLKRQSISSMKERKITMYRFLRKTMMTIQRTGSKRRIKRMRKLNSQVQQEVKKVKNLNRMLVVQ